MIAVIFEVIPQEGHRPTYLSIAQQLRSELETMDGFLSIERFESLTTPGKLLSLSFWRDEASVERWRTTNEHRQAQRQGREDVFLDYRLRVDTVLRDYGMHERKEVPTDSRLIHDSKPV